MIKTTINYHKHLPFCVNIKFILCTSYLHHRIEIPASTYSSCVCVFVCIKLPCIFSSTKISTKTWVSTVNNKEGIYNYSIFVCKHPRAIAQRNLLSKNTSIRLCSRLRHCCCSMLRISQENVYMQSRLRLCD